MPITYQQLKRVKQEDLVSNPELGRAFASVWHGKPRSADFLTRSYQKGSRSFATDKNYVVKYLREQGDSVARSSFDRYINWNNPNEPVDYQNAQKERVKGLAGLNKAKDFFGKFGLDISTVPSFARKFQGFGEIEGGGISSEETAKAAKQGIDLATEFDANFMTNPGTQAQDIIKQAKQRDSMFKRVETMLEGRDLNRVIANDAFIQTVAQASLGRPATADELKHVSEGGAVGGSAQDVLRRFKLLDRIGNVGIQELPEGFDMINGEEFNTKELQRANFGDIRTFEGGLIGKRLTDKEKTEIANKSTEADTTKNKEIEDEIDQTGNEAIAAAETPKDKSIISQIIEKMKTLSRNVFLGEKSKELGLSEKSEKITTVENELNDLRTDLQNQGILDYGEIEAIGDQAITMESIRGQQLELSREQKLNMMISQNNYNNKLVELQIAQGNYDRARDLVKEYADNAYDQGVLEIEALKLRGDYDEKQATKAEDALKDQRVLALKGYTPINNPDDLPGIVERFDITPDNESEFIFRDPVSGKIWLRPIEEEEKLSVAESKSLGVPFGTTRKAAEQMGIIIPKSGSGGGDGSLTKDEKAFYNDIDSTLDKLRAGKRDWGEAFNFIKSKYGAPDETIDSLLNKEVWAEEGAYEKQEDRRNPPKEQEKEKEKVFLTNKNKEKIAIGLIQKLGIEVAKTRMDSEAPITSNEEKIFLTLEQRKSIKTIIEDKEKELELEPKKPWWKFK